MKPSAHEQFYNLSQELLIWLVPSFATAFVMGAIMLAVGQHLILDVWPRGAVIAGSTCLAFVGHAYYRLVTLTERQEVPADVE